MLGGEECLTEDGGVSRSEEGGHVLQSPSTALQDTEEGGHAYQQADPKGMQGGGVTLLGGGGGGAGVKSIAPLNLTGVNSIPFDSKSRSQLDELLH